MGLRTRVRGRALTRGLNSGWRTWDSGSRVTVHGPGIGYGGAGGLLCVDLDSGWRVTVLWTVARGLLCADLGWAMAGRWSGHARGGAGVEEAMDVRAGQVAGGLMFRDMGQVMIGRGR